MYTNISILITALATILIGAELFTNALEHLGERMRLSEGLVGSVFAAVATALPEATVPVVAVFFGGSSQDVREHIGIGSILGPPLMLVSIAFLLMALFAGSKRGWKKPLQPEMSGVKRDLIYFLGAYIIVFISLFTTPTPWIPPFLGCTLVLLYIIYVIHTARVSKILVNKGHGVIAHAPLILSRIGFRHRVLWEFVQLFASLFFIIAGAKLFVFGIEQLGMLTGLSVLTLSLLIIPIATELPEKLNSITWIMRRKDTLAFGNVTGAMVFQGTLLPAFGMQLGSWIADDRPIIWSIILTFAGTLWLLQLVLRQRL